MSESIRIELGKYGARGTIAVVTSNRWFREAKVDEYVCYRSDWLTGACWINNLTGRLATDALSARINGAAQAVAALLEAT
jgi:hypothetical protein